MDNIKVFLVSLSRRLTLQVQYIIRVCYIIQYEPHSQANPSTEVFGPHHTAQMHGPREAEGRNERVHGKHP